MYTVRHVASFVYPAIVVPNGKRLKQRVSMRAPMEYEFTAVGFAEATPNAVVVMTQLRKKDPEIRAPYLGWNGRLWRAVEDPETRRPATMDTYLDRLGDRRATGPRVLADLAEVQGRVAARATRQRP